MYTQCTMKLADYLALNNLTPADFARSIGLKSRMSVHRYLSGTRIPTRRIMARILEVTSGQVTKADFIDIDSLPDCVQSGASEVSGHVEGHGRPAVIQTSEGKKTVVYPWSRFSEIDRIKVDKSFERMMNGPKEGDELSPALAAAITVLGKQVKAKPDGSFIYRGQVIDPKDMVRKANARLHKSGKAMIAYPGVQQPNHKLRFKEHPFLSPLQRITPPSQRKKQIRAISIKEINENE